jgi:hypothetical protein
MCKIVLILGWLQFSFKVFENLQVFNLSWKQYMCMLPQLNVRKMGCRDLSACYHWAIAMEAQE